MPGEFIQSRKLLAIAGISLAAFVAASASHAAAFIHDDEKVVEEKKKEGDKKKRTVRVITSGKPVIIERSNRLYGVGKNHSHYEYRHSHDHEHHMDPDVDHRGFSNYRFELKSDKEHQKALEKAQAALEAVNERLKKAKRAEKKALESARDGLMTAIEALEARRSHAPQVFGWHSGQSVPFGEVFRDFELGRDGDLRSMRVEVLDDFAGFRKKFSDALEGFEIEIDPDGDILALRLDSLKRAEEALDGLDEERLEALKRAEESLRKAREKLEKHLKDKKESEGETDGDG